ncbi:MAG TPA: M12 family metallo-peptidase [Vicinamibacterales bacterium]|jgi:hypothetical protein
MSRHRRLRPVAAAAFLLIASAVAAPRLEGQGLAQSGVFREVGSAAARTAASDGHAIRTRSVAVDLAQIARVPRVRSVADVRPHLQLNLFPDATFDAVLDRVDTPQSGYVWVGHVQGVPGSSVTLSVVDDVVAGSVIMPGAEFTIRYTGGNHAVEQIDPAWYPPEQPPLIPARRPQNPANAAAAATTAASDAQADDGSTIDVMVIYTPAVTTYRGSDAAVRALVNQGISDTNTSYANSGITQRVRLVYTGQVTYTESGVMEQDLDNVTDSSGALTGVGGLRNTYGADLVSLWTHDAVPQYCGIAWVMDSIGTSFAPDGYSVVSDVCVSNSSFAHEMGHNMGAQHDWYVDAETVPRTYAHGYVSVAGGFRTIMAYPNLCSSCARLLAWASPTHTYNGVPMGVAAGTSTACTVGNTANPPCDADDARLLNETASTVANFRQAVPSAVAVTSLTPSVASPSTVNTTVLWTAAATGGTAPYTYKFLVYDGANWTVAQDWSASNVWSWTPALPAAYSVQVWVRNAGSSATYDAWGQASFTVNGPPPLQVTTLSASSPSMAPLGTTVAWTAMAAGGTGPYTYKFLLYDGTSWTVGRDWSTSNSWNWTPAAAHAYSLEVWVRNAGSAALYDAWLDSGTYTVIIPPLTVTSLVSTPASSAPVNTSVVWSASATGGTGPYTYKFLLWNGSAWSVGRDWNAATTWAWTPGTAGAFSVQVWARNAGSSATYDAWRPSGTFSVTGPMPLGVVSLSPSQSSGVAGQPVVWSAAATGGTSPYTYKFLVYDGTTWTIGRDWNASSTWSWTPAATGAYAIQVWVRNAGSSAVYDAWLGSPQFAVAATGPLSVLGLTVGSNTGSVAVNSTAAVTATAAGGVGPYTYKFLVYDGTTWSVGQDWSASNVLNWTPTHSGTYSFQVWVRNAGSVTAWDAWKGAGPVVSP